MRIYLDTCSLQRPLDDRHQVRIALEAEAVLAILALCESGEAELLSSEALMFEIQRIPNAHRRENAFGMLRLATEVIEITPDIESCARRMMKGGIKPLDALHLAAATKASADYFCTCDDRLINKGRDIEELEMVVSPLELIERLGK